MKRVTEHANWRQQISRNSSSRLISGHLVVGGLQLSVDSLVLVHPGCKLLLISLNIFGQSGCEFLTLAGAGFGILEPLGEIANDLLEGLLLGQSDSLGGFERLHVVGDDLVFLSELYDSGLVISETVISALSLNLEGGELLGDLMLSATTLYSSVSSMILAWSSVRRSSARSASTSRAESFWET